MPTIVRDDAQIDISSTLILIIYIVIYSIVWKVLKNGLMFHEISKRYGSLVSLAEPPSFNYCIFDYIHNAYLITGYRRFPPSL